MTFEDEIRLLGQPVKVTLPGTLCKYLCTNSYQMPKELFSGVYDGYALCNLDDMFSYSFKDIYIAIDDKLVSLGDYSYLEYPVSWYVVPKQQPVSFERIHKMILLLYSKIEYLDNRLDDKADRE